MKILSIDTSTVFGSVAISEGGRLVAQEQQGVAGTHSERLLLSIEHLLSIAGWTRASIDALAVAAGPGSFTGLRIGIATAKGMALALDRPIVGISSLDALALNGESFAGTVVPLIDARRGELYAAAWRFDLGAGMRRIMDDCVLPPDALAEKLSVIDGPMLLLGDGALAYAEKLTSAVGPRAILASGGQCLPQAVNLAFLALPRLESSEFDKLAELVPNYIRRSDAEIGFNKRHAT